MLSNFNLSISYEKVLKIEILLANAVVNKIENNNGVYVPPNIDCGTRLHFAIDNVDFRNDTPDGKNELHGTTHVIFQRQSTTDVSNLIIDRRAAAKSLDYPIKFESKDKPVPQGESFPNYSGTISRDELEHYRKQFWSLSQVMDEEMTGVLPTWPAYNSLITTNQNHSQPTSCHGLPLYPSSPTDWLSLYTSLKIVQGINVSVTGSKRTIVTLDLQLYAKCLQLRKDREIYDNYVFRLGELHTVFAMLKVLGKYIESSGIDSLFLESGVYGETTLNPI